jgi:RNA polymerase sigma factor (sigma-70 family)
MMGLSDGALIASVLKGEVRHFSLLMSRHQDFAYVIAYRMMGNIADAEEACQDSFLKAFKNLKSYKKESKFTTWLYTIVYRCCVDRLNKRKKEKESFSNFSSDELSKSNATEQEDLLEKQDRRKMIDHVLDCLDEDSRLILTLHYWKELSLKEIQEIMGLTESNAKVKLFRARKKFEEKLRKTSSFNEIEDYGI